MAAYHRDNGTRPVFINPYRYPGLPGA
ncbi:MAG: hypothetical protein JWR54_2298, partial [Mucilaginibacter sp.]|nr:hypothetical protein [Mucilaginibacter sp.]